MDRLAVSSGDSPAGYDPLRSAVLGSDREGVRDVNVAVVANDDGLALESFCQWLAEDQDVSRTARVTAASTPATGRMGALDIVNVTLTQVASFAGLVMAYASWRRARGATAELTFTVNGVSITVRDASPATVERLLALAEERIQQAQVDG